MNIGLLTTSFPRYQGDVAGHFVLGFARTLVESGHRVEVLAPEPARGKSPPGWRNLSVHWVPYMRPRMLSRTFYGAGVPDNLKQNPLAWLGLAPFAFTLTDKVKKARRDWDLILSHWALPCALVAGALREQRPHIAVFHSADVHLLRRLPGRSLIARVISNGADKLVFVAPVLRDLFISLLPESERERVSERCRVFPMGIDPIPSPSSDRNALRQRFGFNRFVLIFVGRLIGVKGVEDTIRALGNRSDLELVVVGDGPERPLLERLARDRSVPVRFFGKLTGTAKHDLLSVADAFIQPSRVLASGRTEGIPTALVEAMAYGLPIVTTDVGGISSILEHEKSALIVPPGDRAALCESVDRLVSDRALCARLGAQSKENARALVWPSLASKLEELLAG